MDPSGRPIIQIKVSKMSASPENLQPSIIECMELLRLHLHWLNTQSNPDDRVTKPTLQYVVLMDLSGVSFESLRQVDLISWYVRDIIPKYPGMLSAVFVLNYTWAHFGIWNLARRILPSSALSRVFFPCHEELLAYFSAGCLPKEFGGLLPPLSELEDPLCAYLSDSSSEPKEPEASTSAVGLEQHTRPTSPSSGSSMSPTSPGNPFYGYPVASSTSVPTLVHGRRRKRDLFRTLMRLLWARWSRYIMTLLVLFLAITMYRVVRVMRSKKSRWRRPPLLDKIVQSIEGVVARRNPDTEVSLARR